MFRLLIFLMTLSVRALRAIFRTREELLIENLVLRQQVAALKKERPRPLLDDLDRAESFADQQIESATGAGRAMAAAGAPGSGDASSAMDSDWGVQPFSANTSAATATTGTAADPELLR